MIHEKVIFLAFHSCFIEYHNHNTLEACVYFQLTIELALVQNCIIYSKYFFIFKAIYLCVSQLYEHLLTKECTLDCFQVVTICDFLSHKIVSNSLSPACLQHISLLCPPLSPRVCSNSCPLSQRCYLTISFSAALFSFCLQSFPGSGSFPMSCLFASVPIAHLAERGITVVA